MEDETIAKMICSNSLLLYHYPHLWIVNGRKVFPFQKLPMGRVIPDPVSISEFLSLPADRTQHCKLVGALVQTQSMDQILKNSGENSWCFQLHEESSSITTAG